MTRAILFDLDGTLLPMDMTVFQNAYFSLLCKKAAPLGYEPEKLVKSIWQGTVAMMKNDGSATNEQVFWQVFASIYGPQALADQQLFVSFYHNEFQQVQSVCGYTPQAAETVALCRQLGFRVALATSPVYPAYATESRIRWAGLKPQDFEWITTYENISTCKPNPQYYRDVAAHLNLPPEDCLMVGNDTAEDLSAVTVGMKIFLLTDCLINANQTDISGYPHGSFADLAELLRSLN